MKTISKIALAFFCATTLHPNAFALPESSSRECVVLIHGLGRTSLSMKRLEWTLARSGYRVVNFSYPSRKFHVEELAECFLKNALATKIPQDASKVHFITHSMGGIILRQYLSHHSLENLGAIVMLAPPNRGSEIVDLLKSNRFGRWILGPAGCQLGTGPADLPRRLGPVGYDVAVIARTRSLNPFFSVILPGPDDRKVAVENTKVEGMKDFRTIPSSSHFAGVERRNYHTSIGVHPKAPLSLCVSFA